MEKKIDEAIKNKPTLFTENQNDTDNAEMLTEDASADTNEVEEEVEHMSPLNADLKLKRLDERFVYETMQIPTASKHEYRMVTYIMLWARQNHIQYDMDDYGNVYLTKGTLAEGEAYPCVTAHLDTVQDKQIVYAKAGVSLPILTRKGTAGHNSEGKHEIYCDGFGLGGDDKAGIVLCLSMFQYFEKLKACFFLEEETGCVGSNKLEKEWFDNVGYVIGYDSPDLNRAAYSCSGTKLMNKKFFEDNGLAEICAKHGLNDFRAEPYTDVKCIREKTDVICMNFGTGYYSCHTSYEYCVLEDMDSALNMGVDIIEHLGLNKFKMAHTSGSAYNDEDSQYFLKLNPDYAATKSYSGSKSYDYNRYWEEDYYKETKTSSSTKAKETDKKSEINSEVLEYITNRYEAYIDGVKKDVMDKCKENNIDFETIFGECFSRTINF